MDVADRSHARVKERLTRLEAEFGGLEVTQTTFEVGAERYQRAIENSRDDRLDVQVVVRDNDGAVLLEEGDGEWLVPRGRTEPDERIPEAVRRIVRGTADVDCVVTDATTANIHGLRNSGDESADTVYRLSVVFTAEIVDGDRPAGESVRWDADADVTGELT